MRRLWVVASVAVVALVLSVPTLGLIAAWTGSDRLANVTMVLFLTAGVAGFAYGVWTSDYRPVPNLPRRDRKRLRAEEARIRFDAEIARLEKEAGLR